MNYFLLGKILKPHGLKGAVVAFFDVPNPVDYLQIDHLYCLIDGSYIPFFVVEMHQKSKNQFVLSFEGVNHIDQTQELLKRQIFLEQAQEIKALEAPTFKGYKLVDQNGKEIGLILEHIDNQVNPLVSVMINEKEYFVPIAERLIIEVDHSNKNIQVQIFEGLFEL